MLRPLRDWVCIEPIEYKHSFLFVAGIALRKGKVIATGPGRRMRRRLPYRRDPDRPDDVTWFEDGEETAKIRPLRVKVGDVVEFGFRVGTEVPGTKLLMVPEQSIYGLSVADADTGLMELASMALPI
jgi:hypothetical protein